MAAAAAASIWRPQEEGLREICGLLEQHISPTSEQARIWQQLQHYSQFPDFNNYLAFILARLEAKSVEIRQAAGLLLKNNLRTAYNSMPSSSQQYIKSELLPCLGAPDRHIRSTVGTVIGVIIQHGRIFGWPEIVQVLVQCLDSNDLNLMDGALDALSKICEDTPGELDVDVPGLAERPISILLPRFLKFFQSPHALLRKLSLSCVNQYIVMLPAALLMSMDQYLQGLFVVANDPAADVRKLVCSALVQLIEVRPSFLEPHLRNVIEYMIQANKDVDEEVALEACEFCSPRLLLHILKLLKAIWEGGSLYMPVLDTIRNSKMFWGHLATVLSSVVTDANLDAKCLNPDQIPSLAYRLQCQAAVLEIMACDIFFFGKNFDKVTSENQKPVVSKETDKKYIQGAKDVLLSLFQGDIGESLVKICSFGDYRSKAIYSAKMALNACLVHLMAKLSEGDTGSVSISLVNRINSIANKLCDHPAFHTLLEQYAFHRYRRLRNLRQN